jgi:hypothetical protein
MVDAVERHPILHAGLGRSAQVDVQRPRDRAQDDHPAAPDRHAARDARPGQKLLDVAADIALLEIESLHQAAHGAAHRRGTIQTRGEPVDAAARLLVDVGHGRIRDAGLLGDRLRDLAIDERHAELLRDPRADDR